MQGVPYGYCHCGCGERTKIATQTRSAKGHIAGRPQPFRRGHSVAERSYEVASTGCWLWLGARDRYGYGKTKHGRKTLKAHRFYYERYVGPIPPGMELDHLCRVRHCVNPAHLEPVVRMVNAQRGAFAKLTPQDAAAIRSSTETAAVLAARYGVSKMAIGDVRRGRTWRNV